MKNFSIVYRDNWKKYVTPNLLRTTPIHRWLVFPHSFASELVKDIIDEWKLKNNNNILDPFCGAGTTLLTAREAGIPAKGYDISPYAVFSANVKTRNYDIDLLKKNWEDIKLNIYEYPSVTYFKHYPELVERALNKEVLSIIEHVDAVIFKHSSSRRELDFFRLALFFVMPSVSRAEASGGWLRWVEKQPNIKLFIESYIQRVELMLTDAESMGQSDTNNYATLADARCLSCEDNYFDAVITSPPYPNRHDYTRIFGVELMYGFLDWEKTRAIRHQSFHSHPESNPIRPDYTDYTAPNILKNCLAEVEKRTPNPRIMKMLKGYFIDMYCCLKEMKRVCTNGAKMAFVLGNAQYYGQPVPVDEITGHIGEIVGLNCSEIIAVRTRGNSAQQMKKYGRHPSRESVIVFQK